MRPRGRRLGLGLAALAVAGALALHGGRAWAEAAPDEDRGAPELGTRSRRGAAGSPVHGELTMGFLAGGRRYGDLSFAHHGGGASVEGAGGLVQPFEGAPFDSVLAFGLRYDVRLVVSHVRMTLGVDVPFPAFVSGETVATYDVGGLGREVVVQALRPWDLRFGIGGEYPFGPASPFVDLLGTIHFVTADLAVDGAQTHYEATGFGFAARAGVRLHVRPWFFVAGSGEVGLVGPVHWGAELSVGFAVG